MMEALLRDLRQPEYIHVLLNPIPVYGLVVALLGLVIAIFLRSRPAQIVALALVLFSSGMAWPVAEFGERASDRVQAMSDEAGGAWLEAHKHRADHFVPFFYLLALLSAGAIVLPAKFPKSSMPLSIATLLFGLVVLGLGGYIAHAGGRIRHREFRTGPPPKEERTAD
jgi:hypothetical protein